MHASGFILRIVAAFLMVLLPAAVPVAQAQEAVTISAVGDIMMGSAGRMPPHDGEGLLAGVSPFTQGRDVNFGNLEGPLTDRGAPTKPNVKGRSYAFRTPPAYVRHLTAAGINVVSLANNHAWDYGDPGKDQTVGVLNEAGIHWADVGTNAAWTVRGLRVVLLGFYTSSLGEHNLCDVEGSKPWIAEAARDNDLVIVSFHGGAEGLSCVTVPKKKETFLGGDRGDVYAFAHAAIDAGADLVIGHGPHVPRAAEVYKDRLIAYSLGNFCTMGFSTESHFGLAPLLQAELAPDGRLLGGRIVSFRQQRMSPPRQDPKNGAARLMYELGRADFPETNALDENGIIRAPN